MSVKWFVVGDESVARSQTEERFVECYVVLKADTDRDGPFELTRELVGWRDAHRPAREASPAASPRTFGEAVFSDGSGRWNALREPKWQGLMRTLWANPQMFADRDVMQALFSPLAELLAIVRRHVTAVIIVDGDIAIKEKPGDLAHQGRACRALMDCLAALNIPSDTTVDLLFDRDDGPRMPVRKSLLSAQRRRWATRRVTWQRLGDTTELVNRIFLAQCWACANGLPRLDVEPSAALDPEDHDLFESLLRETSVVASEWLALWKMPLQNLPDEVEHLLRHEGIPKQIVQSHPSIKERPLRHLYQALRDSMLRAHSALKPTLLFRGPETLETELAPVMLCPDFLGGLYGFFEHVRQGWKDKSAPSRKLSAVELDPMRRAIGHGGHALSTSGEAVLAHLLQGIQLHVRKL